MRSRKHNFEAAAFWNRLEQAQSFRAVALVIGRMELIEIVPRLLRSGTFTPAPRD
jgi:hypothetical protein